MNGKKHTSGVLQVCATDENKKPCVIDIEALIRKIVAEELAKQKDATPEPPEKAEAAEVEGGLNDE